MGTTLLLTKRVFSSRGRKKNGEGVKSKNFPLEKTGQTSPGKRLRTERGGGKSLEHERHHRGTRKEGKKTGAQKNEKKGSSRGDSRPLSVDIIDQDRNCQGGRGEKSQPLASRCLCAVVKEKLGGSMRGREKDCLCGSPQRLTRRKGENVKAVEKGKTPSRYLRNKTMRNRRKQKSGDPKNASGGRRLLVR